MKSNPGTKPKPIYEQDLTEEQEQIRTRIEEELVYLGFLPHYKAYRNIILLVELGLKDTTLLSDMFSMYDVIAERTDDTIARVERNLRYCINSTWHRPSRFKTAYMNTTGYSKRPKNEEFIACIIYWIKHETHKRGINQRKYTIEELEEAMDSIKQKRLAKELEKEQELQNKLTRIKEENQKQEEERIKSVRRNGTN